MARGTGLLVFSDIYNLDNIVQNTAIAAGRTLLIDTLRECFARSKQYKFERDIFGFPKTPSHLGLDPDAGFIDNSTTRIFIGSAYRYDIAYLPAIIVRQTGSRYKPVSFNQNKWVMEYSMQRFEDGYGNVDLISVPSAYTYAGAWDQTFEIKILSRSLEDTVAIADTVLISLQSTYRDILQQNGLFIKDVSAGAETAENINANDPLFSISIIANTYSEWRREIPVANLIERIQFCFNFDIINTDTPATSLGIRVRL